MLNISVWVLQFVLAAAFLAHDWLFLSPPAAMVEQMKGTAWIRTPCVCRAALQVPATWPAMINACWKFTGPREPETSADGPWGTASRSRYATRYCPMRDAGE